MAFIKKHRLFLLLSLLIAIIDGSFVALTYKQAEHNLHLDEQQKAINHFAAFDIAYQATQENMVQVANIVANTSSYQSLFLKGKKAVEQEGGGAGAEKAKKARNELHDAIRQNWQQFTEKFDARQLHFHLGPGSTSFLRAHKPQKFGDNMDNIRHTIVDTNKLHQPVMGFETGRVYSGIRGTSPVSIINEAGKYEHIGTVEAGASFALVLNNLIAQSNINAAVLLYEEHLRKNVWPDYLKQHLLKTPAINGLVIEQTSNEQITPLTKLTINTDHQHTHIQGFDIDLQIIPLDGHSYLYATKPLRDYLGTKDPAEPDAGQIVIWQDISEDYALFNHHLKINIFYALATFLVIEILVFIALRIISSRLNNTIQHKTFELNSRNHVLEQLAHGTHLNIILESLIHIIEEEIPSALCSVLLLDNDGKHLSVGAAPSLPDFYNDAIEGIKIGDSVGSCGTAAFTKKRIIVEDIQSHPYWAPYKDLAAKANLASCWSEPIISHDGNVLGTFAIYHSTAVNPQIKDLELIESIIQLTTIVIERKKSDEKLQLLSRIYNQTHEGITITDTDGKIIDVNPTFCKITGYTRSEILGQNPSILSSGKQSHEFYAEMWDTLNQVGHWQGEVWNRKKSGEVYAELLTISSIQDENDKTTHHVGLFSDITANKEQQKALEFMAHYDVLTQLPNRSLFVDRFNQAIAHSKRTDTLLAICFLDLDEFKPVNDSYGHDVGDQLLIQVAERIKDSIRQEDTVSRQGGDEFAILLSDIDSPFQGEQMLQRLINKIAQPYFINNNTISISASIGVSLYPLDKSDLDTLLRHADQAMYQAKSAGKNRFQLFNAEDDQQSTQRQNRLSDIEKAMSSDEFSLYYQPKVNMKTGEVFGVEALIRWIHPEKGIIPPLDFLPIIEGTELEVKIGNWVIKQALKQLDIWDRQGIKLEVSVNISSNHLQSSTFFAYLDTALSDHPNISSKLLQLEILESSALGDLAAISNIIKTCQDVLGVNVALDDFGTGYSSLTHLRNLPANTIKIDQSFVRDILDDPDDFSIIDGIVGLAESFNRDIIAEGVETTEHGLMLLLMGCDQAQGYGISRPIPANDLANWLNQYSPNQEWFDYGNKYHSVKEIKIKLLRLTTQHWFEKFEQTFQMAEGDNKKWPLINHKKCHHGAWIERARKEQLFSNTWLENLDQIHERMHLIANKIIVKHQKNETSMTESDFEAFKAAFNDLNMVLGQYE